MDAEPWPLLRPLPPALQRIWVRKLHDDSGLSFVVIGRVMGLSHMRVRCLYGRGMVPRLHGRALRLRHRA